MNFKTICSVCAVLSVAFGLSFVAAPAAMGLLYGIAATDATTLLLARYFGATMLMFGAAVWGLRGLAAMGDQRGVATGLAVATAFGLWVTVQGVASGALNALGWSSVGLYGFFTLAWGWVAFAGKGAAQPV